MTRNVESIFGAVVTAPHQIPYTYTATGGEKFISLPFYPVTGVVTINGGMQVPLDNFEIEGNTLNLGRALSKGDVVFCLFDKILSPEDYKTGIRIYKFQAIGGETEFTPDYTSYGVQSLYIGGEYKTPEIEYSYDRTKGKVSLQTALTAGVWVVAEMSVKQPNISPLFDRSIQEIARSANVKDSEVILSTDTTQSLNGMKIVYSVSEQKAYGLPSLPTNVYIQSVSNGKLTYVPGSVTVDLIPIPVSISVGFLAIEALRRTYAETGYNLVAGSFEAGGTVTTASDVLLYESKGKAYSYSGTLPHTVAAGSTPSAEPEVWLDRSDELGAVKQVGAVSITTINTSIAGMADGELTIPPGEYAIDGDVIIQLKNNESTTGPFGSFRLNAEGVRFTGSGNIIVDSCKRLTIVGIDAPNYNLILRGCWWSNFEGMRFKYLMLADVAGTAFTSNYWCQWTNCQFQSIKTGEASTFNNKFDWYSCSMRGNANQGFSGPADYAFEFNANANAQAWVFWGGDISYHNIAVYNVGAGNTNGDIELTFDGTYFDTLTPAPINRARSRVQTKKCHYSNSTTSLPNSAKMQAVARGGQDMFRQDRSAGWAQFSAINFIPDGDFRVGLPTYIGAGRPIGASGGAVITEASGAIFGRYLNINQAGTSGTTLFRPVPLPFTGRYTAAIIIRNADPGARTIRLGFHNLYEDAEISNTDWTFWTLTVGADIAAGQQPDIKILTNDATPFNVDVCYAAVTFGEGGQPMVTAPAVSELLGSVSYNPPSMATGTGASTTITVNGAELGDFAIPSFGIDLQGIQMWAQVTSANTVTVFFRNETGATIDSMSSTLRVRVVKATYV